MLDSCLSPCLYPCLHPGAWVGGGAETLNGAGIDCCSFEGEADRWRRDPRGHGGSACIRHGVRPSRQVCFPTRRDSSVRPRVLGGLAALTRPFPLPGDIVQVMHLVATKKSGPLQVLTGVALLPRRRCRLASSPLDEASPDMHW